MTREEAIKTIKNRPSFTSMTYDERKQFSEALEVAIKSLEAWEKVKKEIEHNNIYDWIATQSVLDIINKHLSEVSE